MPRTNLLIADDVGLDKTIEAGLVMQELMLRHRARTMLIVCPAGLTLQWRDEMRDKFGLDFRIVDAELFRKLRRQTPSLDPTSRVSGNPRRLVTNADQSFIGCELNHERYAEGVRQGLHAKKKAKRPANVPRSTVSPSPATACLSNRPGDRFRGRQI